MRSFARARPDGAAARLAAIVVWLYPPLAGLVFGDFHENGFAPAAVAWTLYAFDAGMLGWALFGAVVTLAVKEDQAIFLTVAGAVGAWAYRGTPRGRLAGGVAVLAIAVAVAFFAVIQPYAAAGAGARGSRNAFTPGPLRTCPAPRRGLRRARDSCCWHSLRYSFCRSARA